MALDGDEVYINSCVLCISVCSARGLSHSITQKPCIKYCLLTL